MDPDFSQPLQDYYTRAFPQRAGARIHDLSLLSSGWESEIFSFRATWEEAGQPRQEDLVARVYPGGDAYAKSGAEFNALRLLFRLGYPVPRVDCLERDASPIGLPFLIMERIPGQPLWRTMFRPPPWRTRRLVRLFCGLLARLHAIDWRPEVENPREYEPGGPHAIVERVLNTWQKYIPPAGGEMAGFATAFQWLLDHQREVVSPQAALVHMDYHPQNLLLCPDESAVVIDWTNFDISDYRFDLAWMLIVVLPVEGMRWRGPLLREYERQRGRPVEGLEYFEAAACLRRLFSMYYSLVAGADQMGMRRGAEQAMREQAPRLRLVHEILRQRTSLRIPEIERFLEKT